MAGGPAALKSRTEAAGTGQAATESFSYTLDGRLETRTDGRNNDWETVWHTCCGRQQATIDPLGHGTISNTDYHGNVTHTAVVEDVLNHTNFNNPIDAKTLQEVTTRYDERHRPVARTVWLSARGVVDPNNPPIAGDGGVPAGDGLTTRWQYDEDLTDNEGLDQQFSSHLSGLNFGSGSTGSAVLVTNPEGERTLTIKDGLGRTVRVVQLDSSGDALTSVTTTYDAVVNISGFGDVVQTTQSNALNETTRVRTDGGGRTIETVDAEDKVTKFTYDAGSSRVRVRDPNNTGEDCTFDALGREVSCTDTFNDTTQTEYDLAGNVTKQIDAKTNSTVHEYLCPGQPDPVRISGKNAVGGSFAHHGWSVAGGVCRGCKARPQLSRALKPWGSQTFSAPRRRAAFAAGVA